jgi:hypothetical protein
MIGLAPAALVRFSPYSTGLLITTPETKASVAGSRASHTTEHSHVRGKAGKVEM